MSLTLSRRAATGIAFGTAAAAGRASAQQRPYRIFMILWRGWEEACQGFQDYFTQRQLPVELIVRNAEQKPAQVTALVAEAKAMRPDLVYLWGTTTAVVALGPWNAVDPRRHLTDDLPVVFNIVTEPVRNGIIAGLAQPGRRATGTLYITPLDAQLRTMAAYKPFQRIGVTFNPLERNSLAVVELLERLTRELGRELVVRPVPLAADQPDPEAIVATVQALAAEGVDWLYIPPDTFLNDNRLPLTETALAQGLPTFCATERFVIHAYALVGLVSRYYAVGHFTGYKAEQILTGRDAATIPVEALARFSLIINMRVANQLRFYPPLAMLRYAETV